MKREHSNALRSFARELQFLLALRSGVRLAAGWLFIWGTFILVLRVFGVRNGLWLVMGLAGILPVAAAAWWQSRKQRAAFARIRASYDRWNGCGGLIMAEEAGDMSAWQNEISSAAVPKLRWDSGRSMTMLGISAAFVATTLVLPERLTLFGNHRPLEIGQTINQLQAEVETLAQEKILDEKKADEVQKQLSQLQKDSLGSDPDKTWEALDHIKQSNSEQARQATEEALTKMSSLAQAQTMGEGMEQAADAGMSEAVASQAAQDLASMLSAAKLEDGILNAQIPPGLLANLNGLSKEQMDKLLNALESKKDGLGNMVTNLANLKMIDPSKLGECQNAGQGHNTKALADYLASCTNGCDSGECDSLSAGQNLSRGGSGAPMTWADHTSEKDLKFQEHALPPATELSQAQLVGVSRSAPNLSGEEVHAERGALDATAGAGGAANAQKILPEQRAAVQSFFKRSD